MLGTLNWGLFRGWKSVVLPPVTLSGVAAGPRRPAVTPQRCCIAERGARRQGVVSVLAASLVWTDGAPGCGSVGPEHLCLVALPPGGKPGAPGPPGRRHMLTAHPSGLANLHWDLATLLRWLWLAIAIRNSPGCRSPVCWSRQSPGFLKSHATVSCVLDTEETRQRFQSPPWLISRT